MTKDLAILIGAEQSWLSTESFIEKVAANLRIAMAK
jgi:isocitrate dehydrogenase